MRAQHHLFWLKADHSVRYLGLPRDDQFRHRFGAQALSGVCGGSDDLKASLLLQMQRDDLTARDKDPELVRRLARIMADMRAGITVNGAQRRFFLFQTLATGAAILVKFVQDNWKDFAQFATPQYRQLVPLLRADIGGRDGLLMHRAVPNLYLWSPAQPRHPKKLLVCFPTSSNTLNAPLPLAHARLSQLGVALLYVYKPADQHPNLGAAQNWDIARTAQFIRTLAAMQGYDALYGLGASLGGYTACLYGKALDFKRIVNFSGAGGFDQADTSDQARPDHWVLGYDQDRILSVLSQDDATDQKILQGYDAYGFKTQRLMLPSDRHGSFTAAWIGGQLDDILDWALADKHRQFSAQVPAPPLPDLIAVEGARFHDGYYRAMRQPSMLCAIRFSRAQLAASTLRRVDALFAESFSAELRAKIAAFGIDGGGNPLVQRIIRFSLAILIKCGMPVMAAGFAQRVAPASENGWEIVLPAIAVDIDTPQAAIKLVCNTINTLDRGQGVSASTFAADLQGFHAYFAKLAPKGMNTLNFLQAAHDMDIPWRHITKNVYQFGWARRSRWLDSSFTDQTSTISASLARDKFQCAKVLRAAGLPVPRHQLVENAQQAAKVADMFGYPVVLKPVNLDGGTGVMAGLRDRAAVLRAFDYVAKQSDRILVEQFITGNDYRVRVCNNEVIGVIVRQAAAVMGDGQRSINALIDATNQRRSRHATPQMQGASQGIRPIIIDDEVLEWLAFQGASLETILPKGQQIRLRGAANVSLGGTAVDVMARAHPDNLALALDAAAALRLDLAGVDLLLPDIALSWKNTGGAVCEVNSQPQYSDSVTPRHVLERLVPEKGRIPVIVISSQGLEPQVAKNLSAALRHLGPNVCVAASALGCQQALCKTTVAAVIWQVPGVLPPQSVLPIDRADIIITHKGQSQAMRAAVLQASDIWEWDARADFDALMARLLTYLQPLTTYPIAANPSRSAIAQKPSGV
jgi:D-alanine-D-alanine ligase-like ATP-grasp enzyme